MEGGQLSKIILINSMLNLVSSCFFFNSVNFKSNSCCFCPSSASLFSEISSHSEQT